MPVYKTGYREYSGLWATMHDSVDYKAKVGHARIQD
jgi:hypothetical protein